MPENQTTRPVRLWNLGPLRFGRWYVCICPGPRSLILEWTREHSRWGFFGKLPHKPVWRFRAGRFLIEKWSAR